MPYLFGKQSKKDALIKNLGQVFNAIHKSRNIPVGDFPSVKAMREKLGKYDFTRFPKLQPHLLEIVDQMLAVDISHIMKMLPKEEDMTKDKRIRGGVFRQIDNDPFSTKKDVTKEDPDSGSPSSLAGKKRTHEETSSGECQ